MKVIRINISEEELLLRKERMGKVKRFEVPDRVPVLPSLNPRYYLPKIEIDLREYHTDPWVQIEAQLLGVKWVAENIATDQFEFFGPWLAACPDFQNAREPGSLGCEVVFEDGQVPWARGGWLKTEEDLEKVRQIDFIHEGLNGRCLEWRRQWMDRAYDYPVEFLGGPVIYPLENPFLTFTSDGPFTNAADLLGFTELLIALKERPDFVRELLDILTDKIIRWVEFCYKEIGYQDHTAISFSEDPVANISRETYEEIVLPYDRKLRDHFGGTCSFHMCGSTEHLLGTFRDNLRIDVFQGFGYKLDKTKVASELGGRVVLMGNVSPLNLMNGSPESVAEECRECIDAFAGFGGYVLTDGCNIAPGTPAENINTMMEAVVRWGRY